MARAGVNLDSGFFSRAARRINTFKRAAFRRKKKIGPTMSLEISSDDMTPAELFNLAYMRIRPLLVTVPGIVLPHPYGGQDMQVMVNLDQQKLLARNLTPADIHDILMNRQRLS